MKRTRTNAFEALAIARTADKLSSAMTTGRAFGKRSRLAFKGTSFR